MIRNFLISDMRTNVIVRDREGNQSDLFLLMIHIHSLFVPLFIDSIFIRHCVHIKFLI